MGAIIFVSNEACDSDLNKINYNLVNMFNEDVFFFLSLSFCSSIAFFPIFTIYSVGNPKPSSISNFDDSEKLKMLSDNGAFVIAMRSDYKADVQRHAHLILSGHFSQRIFAICVIHPLPVVPPPVARSIVLEGYDGLAGDRKLAFEALKKNKDIIKKVLDIEEKVVLLLATGLLQIHHP